MILLSQNFSQEIVVSTDKSTYLPGDEMRIINSVKNNLDSNQVLIVETHVSGEGFRYFPTILRTAYNFEAFEEREIDFKLHVIETMPPGRYKVFSKLLRDDKEIGSSENYFEVTGTLKTMSFDVFACADKNCSERQGLFKKGQSAFINYISDTPNINVEAEIIRPDKNTIRVKLPAEIRMELAGAYILKATASLAGYKSETRQLELGVLEEEIKVLENRPIKTETKGIALDESAMVNAITIVLMAIIICGLIVLAYFNLKRAKRQKK